MHLNCQSQPKLFWIWFWQFREKTETLPLTIVTRQFLWPWSLNPESALWLARWKRTKRAFHPAFWRKLMKEQFNTHLTMQTISLSCPFLQRKTKGSSSCPLCVPKKKTGEDTGKEEINVFYNQEESGVDSHDQMFSLYTTARKTNLWPVRLFYGMIDSAALNAFVIFTENLSIFGEYKKDKWQNFLKELAVAMIIPHASQRLKVQQTPQDVKQVNRSCGILPEAPSPAPAQPSVIQHSARDFTFVPDQRTRKPDTLVMRAITLCAKSIANGCATNAGVKVRPTDNDTICKIITNSDMKCCGILFGFCNTFSVYFSICFCTFESS